MKARIRLYSNDGAVQSEGIVTIERGKVHYGTWIRGGNHLDRFPIRAVTHIARAWAREGAARSYQGDESGLAYQIEPA